MLGSRADSEDMLQEAYLRWHQVDAERIAAPQAWLTTTITRLCIDRLRASRTDREAYVGPWLPELDLETFISMQKLTHPLLDLIEAMAEEARREHVSGDRANEISSKEFTMQRFNYTKVSPAALQAMLGLENYLAKSSIENSLLLLVKMRASQINGCAYCLDMHSKDARAEGETEQRLYTLDTWRETPFFSPRERAALEWTESLTLIARTHAPDGVYAQVRAEFSEQELADLTLAIVAINGWNRISIGFRTEVGTYQPRKHSPAATAAAR